MPKSFSRIHLINALFWLGVCLNLAGVAVGLITRQWSALNLGLMTAGCVCLGLWLLGRWRFSTQQTGSWWRGRSFQSGTNALFSTLAIIIILALVNLLATRYSTQVDLTENKVFSLAPQTVQVVKQLNSPLEVLIFDDNPPPQSRTLLEQYRRLNPNRFTFKFIDPQKEIGLTQKYDVRNVGAIVLKAGERTKNLQIDLKEVNLTPEIVGLMGKQSKVYFLQGQGELPIAGDQENLSEAVAALQREGFETELLSLIEKKEIPSDADVLVIASPQRQYGAAAIEQLKTYLAGGGHVLLMLDPNTNHGLEPLLQEWGVALDNRLVLDTTRQLVGLGPAVPLVFDYDQHPITKDFSLASYYPKAQALTLVEKRPNQEATKFLNTGQSSWAEADPENEQLEFNADRDSQGPLTIGVAIRWPLSAKTATPETKAQLSGAKEPQDSPVNQQKVTPGAQPDQKSKSGTAQKNEETGQGGDQAQAQKTSKPTPPEARLVVIGDADFAISGFFSDPRVANGDVFLNSVTWLSSAEEKSAISIRPKENTSRQLVMEIQRQQQLFLLGALLPLGALAAAIAIWWQRR